jgi:hypothetical protein
VSERSFGAATAAVAAAASSSAGRAVETTPIDYKQPSTTRDAPHDGLGDNLGAINYLKTTVHS